MLVIEPTGHQSIEATGLQPLPFQAERFIVAAPLTAGGPPTAHMQSLAAKLGGIDASVGQAVLTFPPDAVTAELKTITPGAGRPPIESFGVQASLTRAVQPGLSPAERARAWRAAGGAVELS